MDGRPLYLTMKMILKNLENFTFNEIVFRSGMNYNQSYTDQTPDLRTAVRFLQNHKQSKQIELRDTKTHKFLMYARV